MGLGQPGLGRGKGNRIEMRKIQIVLLAVSAMFALSAVLASSAFAAHEWLNLQGNAPGSGGAPVLSDGTILLHHKPPALLGGGSILISCTGQFHGLVFPLGKDEITDVLGLLSGSSTLPEWLNLAHCEVLSSTNSICPAGTLVTVHAVHLPWATQLLLLGTPEAAYDDISETTAGKGKPGYSTECKSISVECTENEHAKFLANQATGSEFEFTGATSASCSDGGTGTILGTGTTLDWFVH